MNLRKQKNLILSQRLRPLNGNCRAIRVTVNRRPTEELPPLCIENAPNNLVILPRPQQRAFIHKKYQRNESLMRPSNTWQRRINESRPSFIKSSVSMIYSTSHGTTQQVKIRENHGRLRDRKQKSTCRDFIHFAHNVHDIAQSLMARADDIFTITTLTADGELKEPYELTEEVLMEIMYRESVRIALEEAKLSSLREFECESDKDLRRITVSKLSKALQYLEGKLLTTSSYIAPKSSFDHVKEVMEDGDSMPHFVHLLNFAALDEDCPTGTLAMISIEYSKAFFKVHFRTAIELYNSFVIESRNKASRKLLRKITVTSQLSGAFQRQPVNIRGLCERSLYAGLCKQNESIASEIAHYSNHQS